MTRDMAFIPLAIIKNTKLSPLAKIIYGELTMLCDAKGIAEVFHPYYFVKKFKKSPRVVIQVLRQLEENMFVQLINDTHIKLILDQHEIDYILTNRGE